MSEVSCEQEANKHSSRLEDILLLAGSAGGYGIKIREGAKVKKTNFGCYPAYEAEAKMTSNLNRDQFNDHRKLFETAAGRLNSQQRVCMSLINDSYFVAGAASQFVLRISAVEALCGKGAPPRSALAGITSLEQHLLTLSLSKDDTNHIKKFLDNSKRKSIRQGYREKFKSCGLDGELEGFENLYKKRSELVHTGAGRGGLYAESADALRIGNSLLEADLRLNGIHIG